MLKLRDLGLRREDGLTLFGAELAAQPSADDRPDWQQAAPRWIRNALAIAQERPTGGWYAIDDCSVFGRSPKEVWIAGKPYIAWRDDGGLHVAPEACPHMGASLAGARVCEGRVVCPWHGLELGPGGHGGWKPLRTLDDGALLWVQLPGADASESGPRLPVRPEHALSAVVRVEAKCAPRDVVQNRLDPWHGAHYHPHSFGRLRVIEQREEEITVRVAYRVMGSLAVEVDARFHCPDARTIVMTIVGGEGRGSVVETHATPTKAGHTAVVELTMATSERPGFAVVRGLAPILRPAMKWAARRLWVEDAEYAERLYALRRRPSADAVERAEDAGGEVVAGPRSVVGGRERPGGEVTGGKLAGGR